ncbi:hypothetical protein B0H14DRAFT_2593755 [Mycena olivaceomarginata]|nr:hypothetical protein B0H14DRAFT_2593755 [Mycena olivaceomarginata]
MRKMLLRKTIKTQFSIVDYKEYGSCRPSSSRFSIAPGFHTTSVTFMLPAAFPGASPLLPSMAFCPIVEELYEGDVPCGAPPLRFSSHILQPSNEPDLPPAVEYSGWNNPGRLSTTSTGAHPSHPNLPNFILPSVTHVALPSNTDIQWSHPRLYNILINHPVLSTLTLTPFEAQLRAAVKASVHRLLFGPALTVKFHPLNVQRRRIRRPPPSPKTSTITHVSLHNPSTIALGQEAPEGIHHRISGPTSYVLLLFLSAHLSIDHWQGTADYPVAGEAGPEFNGHIAYNSVLDSSTFNAARGAHIPQSASNGHQDNPATEPGDGTKYMTIYTLNKQYGFSKAQSMLWPDIAYKRLPEYHPSHQSSPNTSATPHVPVTTMFLRHVIVFGIF